MDSTATIQDIEQTLAGLLDRMGLITSATAPEKSHQLVLALKSYFAPPAGYHSTVELEEDGRKKRSTASAKNWSSHSGEIRVYYEPGVGQILNHLPTEAYEDQSTATKSASSLEVREASPIVQCCKALADAEKAGKLFIGIKWFRDLVLPSLPYAWTKDVEERQRVLTQAIEAGAIVVRKIPNPRSPLHPTTTLVLNKTSSASGVPSRFHPIAIQGEPASTTLLRDRG